MFKKQVTLVLLLLISAFTLAQQVKLTKKQERDYKNNPRWIGMMDDGQANFYVTVKAFELYWSKRPEPSEEEERKMASPNEKKSKKERKEERKRERKARKKRFTLRGKKLEREAEKYTFEHKKFLHWKMLNEPYVMPDGHVLTQEERLLLWEQEIANRQSK